MKNRLKLISYIIIATLFMQNITMAASETVVTDSDADWKLNWNWERYQEGFEWISSEISVENGLKLTIDDEKFNLFNTYKYACKNADGESKLDNPTGEYKYFIRLDKDGNPVQYNANDTTSKRVPVYHQGRNNYRATFNVGETENNGKPIVFSYDFDITNQDSQSWNSPRMSIMGFTLRHDVGGDYQIAYNGGSINIEKNENITKHSVTLVIAPTVNGGRYQMTAIMLDGVLTPLNNVYSTTSGKTDADCYLSELSFEFYIGVGRSAEITNLKVERGFDDIVLSSDFADGGEIGEDGIAVLSSTKMVKNSIDGKIRVYDRDFDNELISDPGTIISYNEDGMGANVKFTKLESGGRYRMELTGLKDVWGNEYRDTFSVNFTTPESEPEGDIDDTPGAEAGGSDVEVGDITIEASNTLYHGHGFYTAKKDDEVYDVVVDSDAWWDAEQNKYGKNDNYYYYVDADGNEKRLGYGNDSWNQLKLAIKTCETANSQKPLVVSYDWYAENVPAVAEWGSHYMDIMGIYCYLSDYTATQTMLKFCEGGITSLRKFNLEPTADNWHNMKVVISPELAEGRCRLDAVIIDGNITFFDGAYSNTSSFTDENFILSEIIMSITKPTQSIVNGGDSKIKLRNVQISRIDGLEGEIFMPLGVQNPEDAIKLNFNYQINDEIKNTDFTIYEITDEIDEEGNRIVKEVKNKMTVSKEYDGKQICIKVEEGGLYYNRDYRLVINKDIIVEDYISLSKREYEFSTYEYPETLTAELTKNGDKISYNISGGGDSFILMVSTYDETGAMVGLNTVTAVKEGSGSRKKARGDVEILNASPECKVLVSIFTDDGTLKLYRMPNEF